MPAASPGRTSPSRGLRVLAAPVTLLVLDANTDTIRRDAGSILFARNPTPAGPTMELSAPCATERRGYSRIDTVRVGFETMRPWLLGIVALLVAGPAVAAKGRPARVVIDAAIDGATVELDGKVLGKTPLAPVPVSAGKHTLKVKKLGYLELVHAFTARPGATIKVAADLLPFAGVLHVVASVPGAQVAIDGKVVARVPAEVEVKIGSHVITVSAPGYADHVQTLAVAAGNVYEIDARLERVAASASTDDLDLVPLTPRPARPSPPVKPQPSGPGAAPGADDLALEPLVPPPISHPSARAQPASGSRRDPAPTSRLREPPDHHHHRGAPALRGLVHAPPGSGRVADPADEQRSR